MIYGVLVCIYASTHYTLPEQYVPRYIQEDEYKYSALYNRFSIYSGVLLYQNDPFFYGLHCSDPSVDYGPAFIGTVSTHSVLYLYFYYCTVVLQYWSTMLGLGSYRPTGVRSLVTALYA